MATAVPAVLPDGDWSVAKGAAATAAVGRAAGDAVAAGEMAGFVGCGMLYVE